jgi:hypothetical protein
MRYFISATLLIVADALALVLIIAGAVALVFSRPS